MSATQKQLFDLFDGQITITAILRIDDEWQVTGKYCRIALDESGLLDLYICNHPRFPAILPQSVVNNRVAVLDKRLKKAMTVVNGEAWGKVSDKQVILDNLALLGIKKKRRISHAAGLALANRFKNKGDQ